jgi:S-adenosylmethionine hydrolase
VGSFSELDGDEVGLLVDANGQLSLVCNRRAAATVLAVRTGDSVRLGSTPA